MHLFDAFTATLSDATLPAYDPPTPAEPMGSSPAAMAELAALGWPYRIDLGFAGFCIQAGPEKNPSTMFSPEEEEIIALLPNEGWMTSVQITSRMKHPIMRDDVGALLRNLVRRGSIMSAPGKGYRAVQED